MLYRLGRTQMTRNKQCKCWSYNGNFGTVKPAKLKMLTAILPDGTREYKDVNIDACIAPVLKHLWDNGVFTAGSCCGHGDKPPSIVLADGEDNYSRIRELIKQKDKRWFELSQWRRVLV